MVKCNNGSVLEYVLIASNAANNICISALSRKIATFVFAVDIIYVSKATVGKKVSDRLYQCLVLIEYVAFDSINIYDRLRHPGAPDETIAATHYGVSN